MPLKDARLFFFGLMCGGAITGYLVMLVAVG